MGTHLTQFGLGRGLPTYDVVSSCIQSFGHNRHWPKMGEGLLCPFPGRELGPHLTQCGLGPMPKSVPSGVLIHPATWPQYIWAVKWAGLLCQCPFLKGELGPI